MQIRYVNTMPIYEMEKVCSFSYQFVENRERKFGGRFSLWEHKPQTTGCHHTFKTSVFSRSGLGQTGGGWHSLSG